MILINSKEFIDINKIGLVFVMFCMIIILISPIYLIIKILAICFLIVSGYYLKLRIRKFHSSTFLLNEERQWLIQINDENIKMELKEYWLFPKHIFIWLKGSNKSISIMLSRSIIGEQKYSLIRSKLK